MTGDSNAPSTRTPRRVVGGARWRPLGAPSTGFRGSVRGDGRPQEPTPFQGRPGGEGGPPPPRAGWRGGGPPPPRASRRGGGPPGEGGLAGVDPQAWDPRTGPRGGYRGGRPRLPGLPRRTERGGFRSGGGPRPVLGLGGSPLDGIPGIRAPGAKKKAIGPGGGPAGDHELRHGARGARVRPSGHGSRRSWAAAAPPGFEFVRSRPSTTSSGPRKTSSATRSSRSRCRSAAFEGVKGEILFASPPVKPPEGAGCSSGASCGIAVVARGHRCRVRRRHAGGACGRACDRGSPPSRFLNPVQGL